MRTLIADELTRIENMQHDIIDNQQLIVILAQLRAITNLPRTDLRSISIPQPKNQSRSGFKSKKREKIFTEHMDEMSKKKAKTTFGHDAAETWYLYFCMSNQLSILSFTSLHT